MKSRTSSHNRSHNMWIELWKKQIWVFALSMLGFFCACPVFFLMCLSGWEETRMYDTEKLRDLVFRMITGEQSMWPNRMLPYLFVMLGAAAVAAWNAYSFLHAREKSDLYHALPVRREKLFLMELLIGLSDYVAPAAAGMLLMSAAAAVRGVLSAMTGKAMLRLWLIGLLYFLLIFLICTLAMLLTGRLLTGILGSFTLAGIGPLAAVVLSGYVQEFFRTAYGSAEMIMESPFWKYCNPLFHAYISMIMENGVSSGKLLVYDGCACAVLLIICMFLMRIRPSEAAGRAMAFAPAGECIKVILAAAAGLTGGLLMGGIFSIHESGWFLFGLIFSTLVCYAVIQMIYHMDIRMLFGNPAALIISLALTLLTAAFFAFDLSGYDRYLPGQDEIETIGFSIDGAAVSWQNAISEKASMQRQQMECTDENYALLKDLVEGTQEYLAELRGDVEFEAGGSIDRIVYKSVAVKLKNGRTYYRTYRAHASRIRENALQLYQHREYLESTYPIIAAGAEHVKQMDLTVDYLNGSGCRESMKEEDLPEIAAALIEDLQEMDETTLSSGVPIGTIEYAVDLTGKGFGEPSSTFYGMQNDYRGTMWFTSCYLYPSFHRTMQVLKEKGYEEMLVQKTDGIRKVRIFRLFDEGTRNPGEYMVYTDPEKVQEILKYVLSGYANSNWLQEESFLYSADLIGEENGEETVLSCGYLTKEAEDILAEEQETAEEEIAEEQETTEEKIAEEQESAAERETEE